MDPGARQSDDNRPPGAPVPGTEIDIADDTGRVPAADVRWLTDMVGQALGVLGARGSVAVRILADPAMSAAHKAHTGVDGTTDVLTFDLGTAGTVLDTDILICLDEAQRQATARGIAARQELLLYILHGILHCLGHDDHDDAAYARMHAEEDRILTALGIGPVFAKEARP